jgi:hypothetical protein
MNKTLTYSYKNNRQSQTPSNRGTESHSSIADVESE